MASKVVERQRWLPGFNFKTSKHDMTRECWLLLQLPLGI